ncbi:MAG: tetratricopeptide repeat-containing sensor histidine kinase [Bacteroidota bacterium]
MEQKSIFIFLVSCVLSFAQLNGQEYFQEDSIRIEQRFSQLMQDTAVISEPSVVKSAVSDSLSEPVDIHTSSFVAFNVARYYYAKNQLDQALNYIHNLQIPDTARFFPKIKNLEGVIYTLRRNNDEAVDAYLIAAESYAKQGEIIRQHVVYNNIANIYLALGDYAQAYKYSKKCFDVIGNYPENENYYTMMGVLALCEVNLDNFQAAKRHLDELKSADLEKQLLARIIVHYAEAEYERAQKNYHTSIKLANECLAMSQQYQIKQYILISHVVLMKNYNALKKYPRAIDHGQSAQKALLSAQNLTVQHTIFSGLSKAYAGIGDYKKAYAYQKSSDSIRSIDRKQENRAKIDSLMVQFETVEAQNEVLRQRNQIQQQRQTIQERNEFIQFITFILIAVLIIGTSGFFLYRQKLAIQRNKSEKNILRALNEGEEKERQRIASELHDGIASELTALKIGLEREKIENKSILPMTAQIHEGVRRISHNLSPIQLHELGLMEAIKTFVETNASSAPVQFFSNIKKPLKLSRNTTLILYRGTQEIIQNALKHAQAETIDVQVMRNEKTLTISIEDDGIGFDPADESKTIGLKSLHQRIASVGGKLTFDSTIDRGTSFFISISLDDEKK